MDAARVKYPDLEFTFTQNLGFHSKLIDITVQRIEEALKEDAPAPASFAQHPIEKESFRIIGEEMDSSRFTPLELPIVKRVIHSTADFEFKDIIRFSKGAIDAGMAAIKAGKNIVTDVRMVESGIMKYRLAPYGVKTYCFSSDDDVAEAAERGNITKTAASMRKAAAYMEGGIVAIGNAPTALAELLRIIRDGAPRPALIIGVPVGFVGAKEAKDELIKSGLAFIASEGRKGGSTVAVAIVNALAIEAAAK
ncbi:MAG: precorrin-8X methylmutase [Deltaproteobacteria bacterium]|nr:precorrin-8X methylmutase [Deltaproteobacteria bacterium]